MFLIFVNVIFILSAVAMTVLILLQRGDGAAAGSGFGGGASATVFGARGSANFLSKATKWLAIVFFSISLGLAWYASRPRDATSAAGDLGIMGHALPAQPAPSNLQPAGATPAIPQPTLPPGSGTAVPASTTPAVPAPTSISPAGSAPSSGATPSVPAPQPVASPANGSVKPVGKGG